VARVLAAALAAVLSTAVQAHVADDAAAVHASTWPLPWSFEPWVLACLAVSAGLYATGVARLWRHAGIGRGIGTLAVTAFAAGWWVLGVALVSPLDPLGGRLFSAHMVQHELLMVVAAPLLVLGRPLAAWAWALPARWRQPVGRFFNGAAWQPFWQAVTHPVSAWSLHAIALWGWHVPWLFEAALRSSVAHAFQHASFFLTALLLWWAVLGARTRHAQGGALVSLFTTMIHTGALGALMSLSPLLWYPGYALPTTALGLDPLEDQQLGGLVMWIPAGSVYVLVALALMGRLLRGASIPRGSPRAGMRVAQLPCAPASAGAWNDKELKP
jgi:putative membrane protein